MTESFEITKDILEKLQKVELEMLIEVDRICRKIISNIQSCTERF